MRRSLIPIALVLLAVPQALPAQRVVRWDPSADHSDVVAIEGVRYKTIQFQNFLVGVGFHPRASVRTHTMFNLIVTNHSVPRIDVDPESVVGECAQKGKVRTLSYHVPFSGVPSLAQENTLGSDESMAGVVVLRGTCSRNLTIRVPLLFDRRSAVSFEFPF